MRNLLILILCSCFVLLLPEQKTFAKPSNGFRSFVTKVAAKRVGKKTVPNPFRSAKNFFKRMFGTRPACILWNYSPILDTVSLNKTSVITKHSTTDTKPDSCSDESQCVEVTAHATDANNDPLVYNYQASAGRIIGSGSRVVWDLSNVAPGKHTITINADDGCGICGIVTTMEIKVVECAGCSAQTPNEK